MRRTSWFLVGSLVLPALARGADAPPQVARVFATQVKAGMNAKYEAGRKRHMEWHRKQADTWAWFTWEVETGDRAGMFEDPFGHHWSVASHVEDVPPDEMMERGQRAMGG